VTFLAVVVVFSGVIWRIVRHGDAKKPDEV